MKTLTIIASFLLIGMVSGKTKNPTSLTKDDSTFVHNIVSFMKPLHYTVTKSKNEMVLVMVFEDHTEIDTLVDGFILDIIEIKGQSLVVYPRESD
jgi:hypothetical protein